jgi:galactokinase
MLKNEENMNDLMYMHKAEYGIDPEVIVSASGSVNLMGEHTDYNDGYVLQVAIDRSVYIAVSRRKDNALRFYSADLNERKRTTIANLKYKKEDRWANYIKGVIFEMNQIGFNFKGMDITVSGDIPQGIGLASSSAMEIATATAVKKLFKLSMKDAQIMQSAQLAESSFMGMDTEITDQLVSCVSKAGNALFIDLRKLDYEYIPLKLNDTKILITNSNIPLASAPAELRERKQQCRDCVSYLNKKKSGSALRDYSVSDLQHSMGIVPEHLRRICLHVVEENLRTLEAKEALKDNDLLTYGKLLNRSHESLRDQYEVSCPEIDWLVKRAWEIDGVLGSRMTGRGFGGCTITLIRDYAIDKYLEKLEEYERIFGFRADYFFCKPSDGVKIVYHQD